MGVLKAVLEILPKGCTGELDRKWIPDRFASVCVLSAFIGGGEGCTGCVIWTGVLQNRSAMDW